MRVTSSFALLSPALVAGSFLRRHVHLDDAAGSSITRIATPASIPTSGMPIETSNAVLELRQDPGLLPINAVPTSTISSTASLAIMPIYPAANPEKDPGVAIPQAVPAVPPPAITTSLISTSTLPGLTVTSTLLASPGVGQDFVTTQWIETWIGGTSQTWVPKTITFHFGHMSSAPAPGKGEIGMGTLTGRTGRTQTVMLGAAPTQGVRWVGVGVAAVGAGVVGMVV